MRTHSRAMNTDKPSSFHGRANTIDPPPAPTLDDTLIALVNVIIDNA